jgi:hypothetical protein
MLENAKVAREQAVAKAAAEAEAARMAPIMAAREAVANAAMEALLAEEEQEKAAAKPRNGRARGRGRGGGSDTRRSMSVRDCNFASPRPSPAWLRPTSRALLSARRHRQSVRYAEDAPARFFGTVLAGASCLFRLGCNASGRSWSRLLPSFDFSQK